MDEFDEAFDEYNSNQSSPNVGGDSGAGFFSDLFKTAAGAYGSYTNQQNAAAALAAQQKNAALQAKTAKPFNLAANLPLIIGVVVLFFGAMIFVGRSGR